MGGRGAFFLWEREYFCMGERETFRKGNPVWIEERETVGWEEIN
jgi:hypothetical protein